MWLSQVKVLGGPRAEIRFRAARPDMVVIEHLRPTDEPPKYFQPPVRRMARSSVHSPKRNLFPAISGATTARAAPSRQERTFVFQVLPKAVGRATLPKLVPDETEWFGVAEGDRVIICAPVPYRGCANLRWHQSPISWAFAPSQRSSKGTLIGAGEGIEPRTAGRPSAG